MREGALLAELRHPEHRRLRRPRHHRRRRALPGDGMAGRREPGRAAGPAAADPAREPGPGCAPRSRGLRWCTARGIVHRDLKPSNLFLRQRQVDDVVLLDLGIARQLERGQRPHPHGVDPGHAQLHGARAGAGAPGSQPGGRRVLAGLRAVRVPDRRPALRRGARVLRAGQGAVRGAAPRLRELRPELPEALDGAGRRHADQGSRPPPARRRRAAGRAGRPRARRPRSRPPGRRRRGVRRAPSAPSRSWSA